MLLTLSNTVQNAIIGPDNSISGGLIGASTLLAVNYFAVRFLFNHPRVDRFVEGRQAVLIEGGKLVRDNMRRELITRPDSKRRPQARAGQAVDGRSGRARTQRRDFLRGQGALGRRSAAPRADGTPRADRQAIGGNPRRALGPR